MKLSYPLSIQNDRNLPEHYSGRVYIWDIDKTYLSTRFSSLQGLARIPVEFAIDKEAIPGMPQVLQGLRRGVGTEVECVPLYFISASPPFLRHVVEKKMLLDGVEQDGITFKDWLRTLWELHPGRLFDQLGFKLAALFAGRSGRIFSEEYLFGDDYEKDAEAFSLYARWINSETDSFTIEEALIRENVPQSDREGILYLLENLPAKRGKVGKIYIHLEKNSPPETFKKYGKLLVPVKGAYQLALALFEQGLVDAKTVHSAREEVTRIPKYIFKNIKTLDEDALNRKIIQPLHLKKLHLP
jgi:hypothetical protein